MLKLNLFIFIFLFSFWILFVCAQDYNQTAINNPPGTEVVRIGNVDVVVPEGSRVRKRGGVMFFEDTGQYTGRRFYETDQRLAAIEAKQEELAKQIEELRAIIENLQNSTVTSKQ